MLNIKQKLSKHKSECYCTNCSSTYICNHYDAAKSKIGHLCNKCKNLMRDMTHLTQESLHQIFNYDKDSGNLRVRLPSAHYEANAIVGYPHTSGYLSVLLGKKEYLLHRIIWLMQTGEWPTQIDHINHNRKDNSWDNLRAVESRENSINTSLSKNNTSGVNGVRILPSGNFAAYIMVNRKQISLGTHPTLEDAKTARTNADKQYGFHVNHGI